MFNNFFTESRAVCEIEWITVLYRGRPRKTTWRMRNACWIPMATHTPLGCVIPAFTPQQEMQERASMLRYAYISCLFRV
jgi:hypothetical protein